MRFKEFCKILPKVELHAHLNGSLSKETLLELGVPTSSLNGYQIIRSVPNNSTATLAECFKLFRVAHKATASPEAVYIATKNVIEEFHNDNVVYLELRTTPRQESNMTKKEYIKAVIRAIKENPHRIKIKLILSIDRSHSLEASQKTLKLIIEMHELYPDIIKGVDLCGNPHEGEFHEHLFKTAKNNGLKVTLHCGEIKNDQEVKRMLTLRPDRIGHATCIHPNYGGCNYLWELYKNSPIPTECCLTSNVLCKTIENYEKHHVKEWKAGGFPFCICTDDKGVFCTTSSDELAYAAGILDISKDYLLNLTTNSVDYSFASEVEKQEIKNLLRYWKKENKQLFL